MHSAKTFVGLLAMAFTIALVSVTGSAQKGPKKIAVLNFDDSEASPYGNGPVGKRVANYTIDKLVKGGAYIVVEREVIDKILREQNFGASGRVDKGTAAEIGKVSGADIILYGVVTKCKYETPFGINIFKRKGRGTVEVTARLTNTKTAEIFDTIQVKGEASKEKVEAPQTTGAPVGVDDFKTSVINEAAYDAANKLAAELEKRSGFKPPDASTTPPAAAGSTSTSSGDVRSNPAPQGAQDQKQQPQPVTPSKPQPPEPAQTPAPQDPAKPDSLGLVSTVVGNTVQIVLEQEGKVKTGDKLLIKRKTNPIPDPYKPGSYIGYEFKEIGYVVITEVVSSRVVKGTFVPKGGRPPAVRLVPRFQDLAVIAP